MSQALWSIGSVMRTQTTTAEEVISRIASKQHGVVLRSQLLNAGIGGGAITRRIGKRSLMPVHPGVYRVGHRAPNLHSLYLAAVLACGEAALLSGLAAAHLHGLHRGSPPPPEVTTPLKRSLSGVRIHRTRRLDPRDRTFVHAIPVTTVPRTLVDLAGVLSEDALARTCHEATIRVRAIPMKVEQILERARRRQAAPGAAR